MTDVFVTSRLPCLCPSERHKHDVSIQSSTNLGDTLLRMAREWKTAETWFLARLFLLQSSIISQILEFIYWMVTTISFDHMTGENQEYSKRYLESCCCGPFEAEHPARYQICFWTRYIRYDRHHPFYMGASLPPLRSICVNGHWHEPYDTFHNEECPSCKCWPWAWRQTSQAWHNYHKGNLWIWFLDSTSSSSCPFPSERNRALDLQ